MVDVDEQSSDVLDFLGELFARISPNQSIIQRIDLPAPD